MTFNPLWRIPAYGILAAAIAATIITLWFTREQPDLAPVGAWQIANPSPHVGGLPTRYQPVKGGKVKVYEASVKNGLKLPPAIKDDPASEVIASTRVEADDHPSTVTTVINTETGDSQTLIRREPLPWLAWSDRGGVGIYAGIKNGEPTARLQLHQEIFTVKAIHFGAIATIDQPISGPLGTDYFAGVGAEYRW